MDNRAAGSTLSFASVLTHSDNRAYLASCLRHFAQICSDGAPQTSDTLLTLSERYENFKFNKLKGIIKMADSKFKFKDIVEGIAGAFLIAAALLTPFLRSWRTKRGATDAEVHRSLPGDDLVPHPKWGWTHAIAIRASAADVWPWLMQMGQGRGGMYSYEWLENLVGGDIHNAADQPVAGRLQPESGKCAYLPRFHRSDQFRDGSEDASGHQGTGRDGSLSLALI